MILKSLVSEHHHDIDKRVQLREFLACTQQSLMERLDCLESESMDVVCRIKSSFCTYESVCKMNDYGSWNCDIDHIVERLQCCDFKCKWIFLLLPFIIKDYYWPNYVSDPLVTFEILFPINVFESFFFMIFWVKRVKITL